MSDWECRGHEGYFEEQVEHLECYYCGTPMLVGDMVLKHEDHVYCCCECLFTNVRLDAEETVLEEDDV